MSADPLEDVWRPVFPTGQAKHLGPYGHLLQWEDSEEGNRALLAFLAEEAGSPRPAPPALNS
jgi:hypothetical protein